MAARFQQRHGDQVCRALKVTLEIVNNFELPSRWSATLAGRSRSQLPPSFR
jgi:hypothetical protein